MAYPAFDYLTPDAYLELERQQGEKHVCFEGSPYATAGADGEPKFIVAALVSKVDIFPGDRTCKILTCDLRVTTPEFGSCRYADNTLSYETHKRKENRNDTLTNPTTIAEVISPTTGGVLIRLPSNFDSGIFTELFLSLKEMQGN